MIDEILRLLWENNMMLKFICEDIIKKASTQDTRDIINNIIGDQISESMSKRNK